MESDGPHSQADPPPNEIRGHPKRFCCGMHQVDGLQPLIENQGHAAWANPGVTESIVILFA
jgi:hypothetical protein